jgi:hypothetical protein
MSDWHSMEWVSWLLPSQNCLENEKLALTLIEFEDLTALQPII